MVAGIGCVVYDESDREILVESGCERTFSVKGRACRPLILRRVGQTLLDVLLSDLSMLTYAFTTTTHDATAFSSRIS